MCRHYIDGFSPEDLSHLEEEFREESLLGQSAANIRIEDPHGARLFRTPETENWPDEMVDVSQLPITGRFRTIKVRHQTIRVLTAPVRVGVVQIGLPIDEFEEVRDGFLWLIGLGSPVLLLLAWLGGYWMSGRALKPVDEISAAAASINANKLFTRLPSSGLGDELDRLSQVLNGMLARIEAAFKRVTEFTADASHELRTPLAVIQTTAELMQIQPRSVEEHLRAWHRVSTETERTSGLISDLLTLARADAGKSDLDFGAVDIMQVVHQCEEEMRVLADGKGLSLSVAGSAGEVRGDADALHRVICILLDNAIKYTAAPGEVRLEVIDDGQARISISDSGAGINTEDLAQIFERFYRVSKDRSRKTGGTGLGLSIARSIVERHGGEIRAESTPGKGSRFTIILPKFQS